MANAVHIRDPFRPQLNPIHHAIAEPTRIDRILREHGLIKGRGRKMQRVQPFVVAVNGEYVLQADWARRVRGDDLVVTVPLPPNLQGGGKSNPLQIVLQLALVVAAFYVPGALGLVGWQAGAVQAGIMLAGGMLINALLPAAQAGGASSTTAGVQSNLIGTQNNQARLRQAMPVLYGRRRFYPDLAAMPYTECSDNKMYLNQLFCLTQGKMSIEQICIEKTPIGHFSEVEYQVVEPYGEVTLFPDNVYSAPEVADIELQGSVRNNSGATVLWHEQKTRYITNQDETVTKTIEYTEVRGDVSWKTYIATPLGQQASRLSLDFSMPSGLAKINDSGDPEKASIDFAVEIRQIDDSNSPVGNWVRMSAQEYTPSQEPAPTFFSSTTVTVPVSERITAATLDGQLRTLNYNVPKGRYEVRVARFNEDSDKTNVSDSIHWVGLRSFMPSVKTYGNCTMLAVRIKATDNLNQNIARRVNVLGTRILPVWDGSSWSEQITRSPAWAVADVLRNIDYGRKLKDKRMNLTELLRLSQTWAMRGDTCDGLFTDHMTVWDALCRLLEVGRTKPIYYAGVIDFVRNEPKMLTQAYMFTPDNMLRDSFSVEYAYPKTDDADHIIIEYTDGNTNETRQVECYLSEDKRNRPLTVQLPFCTNRAQAWREGIHRVAMNQAQRKFPAFTTELEGMLPKYGDKLLLNHDVPEWCASGYIRSVSGNIISTSEYLPWVDGASHVMLLRGVDGRVQGSFAVTKVDDSTAQISGNPYISNDGGEVPTQYTFGTTEKVGLEAIMLSASPDDDKNVAITCVNYSNYPHEAENLLTMPIEAVRDTEDTETLIVTWLKVKESIVDNLFDVTCNTVRDAVKYEFAVSSDGGLNWAALESSNSPSIATALPYGDAIKLRARAVGTYNGEWFVTTVKVVETITTVGYIAPTMVITSAGGSASDATKTFNVQIKANGVSDVVSYQLQQGDLVIWSGFLSPDQTVSEDCSFGRHYDTTIGSYIDSMQVVFKAFGYDAKGNKTDAVQQTVVY